LTQEMHTTGYPDEPVLTDDYPVHFGYWYVKADNGKWRSFESDISGTAGQLARYEQVTEIRRCNIAARMAGRVRQ